MTEDVPECETVKEEKCQEDPHGGDEWCHIVPRQVCTLVTKTSTKVHPKTECSHKENRVCGPEECPLIRGEKKCREEVKTVSDSVFCL